MRVAYHAVDNGKLDFGWILYHDHSPAAQLENTFNYVLTDNNSTRHYLDRHFYWKDLLPSQKTRKKNMSQNTKDFDEKLYAESELPFVLWPSFLKNNQACTPGWVHPRQHCLRYDVHLYFHSILGTVLSVSDVNIQDLGPTWYDFRGNKIHQSLDFGGWNPSNSEARSKRDLLLKQENEWQMLVKPFSLALLRWK